MKKLAGSIAAFILLGSLMGCVDRQTPVDEKIDNVVRIFMHSPRQFSVLVESGSNELTLRTLPYLWGEVKIFTDVPRGQKNWVILNGYHSTMNGNHLSLELHIHSPKDVEGGGWDHGKSGKGMTQVIE